MMRLNSTVFNNNQHLPEQYTCDGENINPPLTIAEVPEQAKSLVLIVEDLDALMGIWVHWLLFNINPTTTTIEANSRPVEAVPGLTGFGSTDYGGPCPSNGTHRYLFKLYALDLKLQLPAGINKETLEEAIRGHVIAQTQLIGLYRRK